MTLQPKDNHVFNVPTTYKCILHTIETLFMPTAFLVGQYKEHYRNNNLLYLMNIYSLNTNYIMKLFDRMKNNNNNCSNSNGNNGSSSSGNNSSSSTVSNTNTTNEYLLEDTIDPYVHMENLGKLMLLEETHMRVDIAKFDMHYQELVFTTPNSRGGRNAGYGGGGIRSSSGGGIRSGCYSSSNIDSIQKITQISSGSSCTTTSTCAHTNTKQY